MVRLKGNRQCQLVNEFIGNSFIREEILMEKLPLPRFVAHKQAQIIDRTNIVWVLQTTVSGG